MALFFTILAAIRCYIDLAIDYIFGLYYNSTREFLPTPKNLLVLESATSLARKIREGNVTSEEVVQAFIDQIEEVNPMLNAVVDSCFEKAIEEARTVDKKIASSAVTTEDFVSKPFLGVPFTTKDSTACKGLRKTIGLICRKDTCAEEDADMVKFLKNAGGILLGVTNVPQMNMWQETSNPVYGRTKNPYNTTRNVGGSSGGEASIIAACGSPFGIGTDIGGSIRIPSFSCGLFGHKSSPEVTPMKGVNYRDGSEGRTMVVGGPMVKYAEDLLPFLKVLCGPNVNRLDLDASVDLKKINIFYCDEYEDPKVSAIRPEMKEIFVKVVNYFGEWSPEKLALLDMRYGGNLWRYWMTKEPNACFKKDLTDRKGEVKPFREFLKFFLCQSEYDAGSMFNLINGLLPQEDAEWAERITESLKKEIVDKLGTNGVLLYPSAPWPASYHLASFLRPWNFFFFVLWNALNLPVTQVPLGLSKDGMPLGIQVVAAPYQDRLCIAVAKELEKGFGGYVPPFKVDK